jgi:hypothetical protein
MERVPDRIRACAKLHTFGRYALIATLWLLPQLAFAAESYRCTFTEECIGSQACVEKTAFVSKLYRSDGAWHMTKLATQQTDDVAVFDELKGSSAEARKLLSTNLDPDADTVSLLSISETGEAILSTHGYFPSLGVVTHLGICLPEDG